MFEMALKFLADPIFFAGFSVVIGVAYVAVWVVSLKEIARPSPQAFFKPVRSNQQYDIQERQLTASGPRRRNGVRVQRKDISEKAGQRGRRAVRAA